MKFFSKSWALFLVLFIFTFLQSCTNNSTGYDFSEAPPPFNKSAAVRDSTYANGLETYVIEEGEGQFQVGPNDKIQLRFTGRKQSNGKIFDTSYRSFAGSDHIAFFSNLTPVPRQNEPTLIKGFRLGLMGMKEGEKRIIIVPPSLGYSNARVGTNRFDLRGETLVYDVELVDILF